jgi:hypothetical protein
VSDRHRFRPRGADLVAFVSRSFPQIVGLSWSVSSDLSDDHDVQAVVQLPVSGTGEAVSHNVVGGHFDRGGPGV